jgi:hypothetical protein
MLLRTSARCHPGKQSTSMSTMRSIWPKFSVFRQGLNRMFGILCTMKESKEHLALTKIAWKHCVMNGRFRKPVLPAGIKSRYDHVQSRMEIKADGHFSRQNCTMHSEHFGSIESSSFTTMRELLSVVCVLIYSTHRPNIPILLLLLLWSYRERCKKGHLEKMVRRKTRLGIIF